jgi:hypothetical protein
MADQLLFQNTNLIGASEVKSICILRAWSRQHCVQPTTSLGEKPVLGTGFFVHGRRGRTAVLPVYGEGGSGRRILGRAVYGGTNCEL